MGFALPHITVLFAIVAVSIALLFQIIGVAAPGWFVTGVAKAGLWKVCLISIPSDVWTCYTIEDARGWMDAARAFGLMGVVVMAASALCGLLLCFLSASTRVLSLVTSFAAFTGAIFSIIEWAIMVGETSEAARETLDYCFGLTVTASILCLIATALFLLGRNTMGVS